MKAKLAPEEIQRIKKMSLNEKQLRKEGVRLIAGIDEAGRGPLAGPVVAAACILPENFRLAGINDSKQLLPELRMKLYQKLIKNPKVIYAVGVVDEKMIDEINILQASLLAMERAVEGLATQPEYVLVDGIHLPGKLRMHGKAIVKGDSNSISIAAASIIAKCTRDLLMEEAHQKYPQYQFHQHKGYGTQLHLEMLKIHGPSPIHRMTFEPVKKALTGEPLDSLDTLKAFV
jgi:ribonuclease HII